MTYTKALDILCETFSDKLEIKSIWVNALEKQIPKRVKYETMFGLKAECPICKSVSYKGVDDWDRNYCSNCGQALDWSK